MVINTHILVLALSIADIMNSSEVVNISVTNKNVAAVQPIILEDGRTTYDDI